MNARAPLVVWNVKQGAWGQMTKTEILQLEGRRLDAAIAQYIFGWKDVREENGEFVGIEFGTIPDPIPYFSHDLNLAWEVVEAMSNKGFIFTLMHHTSDKMPIPFPASVTFQKTSEYSVNDSDPAKAICRAALLAFFGEAS